MKKNILKIFIMFLIIPFICGCGELSEEEREAERNYKEMLEEKFKGIEYNVINEETVEGIFVQYGKKNKYDIHIIDAELKKDPTVKFRICTGFSEVPTFSIAYDQRNNYYNALSHKNKVEYFQNSKIITIKSETHTEQHYSNECEITYYDDTLIVDKNSSVEEIAQELTSYSGEELRITIQYGDVELRIVLYNDRTFESYIEAINKSIEEYNSGKEYRNYY